MNRESEPTREKLMAMAYADGELDEAGRREFEALLAGRPDLVKEVSAHQQLLVLGRQAAGPEPMDYEWQRLEGELMHRAGHRGGLALLVVGALGAAGWAGWAIARGIDSTFLRVALGLLLVGSLALFLATLRARLRTLPYDPYRDIQR